jgi:hypothetical protein
MQFDFIRRCWRIEIDNLKHQGSGIERGFRENKPLIGPTVFGDGNPLIWVVESLNSFFTFVRGKVNIGFFPIHFITVTP